MVHLNEASGTGLMTSIVKIVSRKAKLLFVSFRILRGSSLLKVKGQVTWQTKYHTRGICMPI